jgi:uncharacterized protein
MLLARFVRRAAFLSALLAGAGHAAPCPPSLPPPTAAQRQEAGAHDRGLLWTLQRDGHTSYLYGTLHVGRAEWAAPGPQVAAALAATEVLALEIDPADPGLNEAFAGAAGDPPPALPPALQQRLRRQFAAACLDADALAGMPPAMQALVLGVLEARWVGLDPGYGQEQALARSAHASGRPVLALETVALQKKALLPDDAGAALVVVEQALEQLESGNGRATIARLAQAWERGDLTTIEDYASWCACLRTDDERATMRALNDDRNPGLAEHIDALHRAGRPVFAAVGALHMTGPAALQRLLAARGFRVERVALVR